MATLSRNSAFGLALLACLGSLLTGCLSGCLFGKGSEPQASHGGGSETTLTGFVRDAEGRPVAGAAIRLWLQDDPPPNLFSKDTGEVAAVPLAFSQADGSYRLPGVAGGEWFLECRSDEGKAAVLRVETGHSDSLGLPDAVLRPSGSVRGRVVFPGDTIYAADTYVYIPGLWKRTIARQSQGFIFELGDIPAGTYTLVVQPAYAPTLAMWNIRQLTITIEAGGMTDVDAITLPLRSEMRDPAYQRDSAAAWAVHLASLDSGATPQADWVTSHTAVSGNRITMLYDFEGSLRRIPPQIKSLDALEVIYLIGGGDSTPQFKVAPEVSALPHLNRLWLTRLNLGELGPWVGTFPSLSNLNVHWINQKGFPEWVLGLQALTRLSMNPNGYTDLPKGFDNLRKLRVADLSGNDFATVPRQLLAMTHLQGVRLRGNKLCGLPAREKAWVARQDSLWQLQIDPFWMPESTSWESTQRCAP